MTKTVELKDIYTPLFENVVVEFIIPEKTKSGIHLSKEVMKRTVEDINPTMKIVAIGTGVKNVKVGDWVLPSPALRPLQVPLLYKDASKGVQHAQIHISDIMGIVDADFAQVKNIETEKIIN